MTQRLKRWESPRRQGRNDKGKGGSARQRQLKKQTQMLRKKLQGSDKADQKNQQGGRDCSTLPFFLCKKLPTPLRVGLQKPSLAAQASDPARVVRYVCSGSNEATLTGTLREQPLGLSLTPPLPRGDGGFCR